MKVKKVKALALAAIILVCTSVAATMAYFTYTTEEIKNTVAIGKIGISLDEAVVDEYGVKQGDKRTTEGNLYKLIPGHTYIKDPTVTVAADSEQSYIRMIVTVTDISDVKKAFGVAEGEYFLPQNFVSGWDPSVWLTTGIVAEDSAADTAEYEFRYFETVNTLKTDTNPAKAKTLDALFDTFTVPSYFTQADINLLEDMEIIVVAHAIQADGFADADAAWNEFSPAV